VGLLSQRNTRVILLVFIELSDLLVFWQLNVIR